MRLLLHFTFAMLAGACSSAESPPPIDDGHATAVYHFDFETAPGTETYWCQYALIPANGGKPADVSGFRWESAELHHWALFRTHGLDASAVDGKPFVCFGSEQTKAADLASIISVPTTTQTELIYPDGYSIPFAPGEIVMLQAHTVNATPAPIAPSLDLTVLLAGAVAPTKKLGEFQFYDPFIHVPAHGDGHASMRCAVPTDVDMVWMSTHEHTRGSGFKVFFDPPSGPPSDTPLLSAGSWDEPASKLGVTHVPAGSSFRVFCDYKDTSGVDAYQGPNKASNEMCQFYGAYSPPMPGPGAVLFEACVPGMFGGTGDMYGTGTKTCADTLGCIAGCSPSDAPKLGDGKFEVGACWQSCMVDSCPSASTQLNTTLACLGAKCQAECAGGAGDPNCQTCLGAKCAADLGGCQSATCAAP